MIKEKIRDINTWQSHSEFSSIDLLIYAVYKVLARIFIYNLDELEMTNIKVLVDRIDRMIFDNVRIKKEIKILSASEYNTPKM